jgi:DNA-binding winged helix-turn-helix (wHTH) protein
MELMPDRRSRGVRFGVFEVDLRAGELRRNGVKVKVQNQPFQILAMLLERPGEIITRDEMRSRLWRAETFVDFDRSQLRDSRLRDALGDSAENPAYVETLGRNEYRFVFPVEITKWRWIPEWQIIPISGPVPQAETSPASSVQNGQS